MTADQPILIHNLQKQDAAKAYMFMKEKADGAPGWSIPTCYHHAAGIFIAEQDGMWVGLLNSYKSPDGKAIGVIENLLVDPAHRRKGIAKQLLAYVLDYWKNQCVFTISYMPELLDDAATHILEKFNFKPVHKDGLQVFIARLLPEKICMHNRLMRPSMNTINGEVNEDTLFEYFQKDEVIWGTYSGGNIVRGVLLGKMARNGNIDFEYKQLNVNGEIYSGHSKSSTEFLNDGRIVLYEDWEWTGNKSGGGRSVIEEIKQD